MYEDFTVGDKMLKEYTFFEWEEPLEPIENVVADILVNGKLKLSYIKFDRIEIKRNKPGTFSLRFYTKQPIHSEIIKGEKKTFNLNIELKIKDQFFRAVYNTMVFNNSNFNGETRSYSKDYIETRVCSYRVIFTSDKKTEVLKEWYGCRNQLRFYSGVSSSKTDEETIIYRDGKKISFKIQNRAENYNRNSFWIKLKNYKFKVILIESSNKDTPFTKYALEYRTDWGEIPNEDTRFDISTFLSFIIGTKLVKLGESHFSDNYISQKEYIAPTPLDESLLYQTNFPFYNVDYRYNDTDAIIKQLPKMLNRYFLLKENYRLNEVLSILFIHSYLNFNFVSYVTYIEMFSNIEVGQKPVIISKSKFKPILKALNAVKNVPQSIKSKFPDLNKIGIGKKVQRLLKKYKIDYDRYKDVFTIRGKVVHGALVDIEEMHTASEQAKELLTILTLKKLNYVGYIRNFTNNNELILVKDMSKKLL
jgi:hypothetical protein